MAEHGAGRVEAGFAANLGGFQMTQLVGKPVFHASLAAGTPNRLVVRARSITVPRLDFRLRLLPILLAGLHLGLPPATLVLTKLSDGLFGREQIGVQIGLQILAKDRLALRPDGDVAFVAEVSGFVFTGTTPVASRAVPPESSGH